MMPIRLVIVLLVVSGCASQPPRNAEGHPPLERLSPTAVVPRSHPMKLEDLVAMERAGYAAPDIVLKMRRTATRMSMTMAQQQRARELGASATLIQALVRAEDEAREADRLTEEADQASAERERRERELEYWNSYYNYPYYDPYWPRPYFGYGAGHDYHGWGVGLGWGGWGW